MQQEIKQYPFDFAVLFASFLAIFLVMWQQRHFITPEKTLLFILVGFYFLWGVGHHWHHHDLTLRIVTEYLSFALLALVLGLLLITNI